MGILGQVAAFLAFFAKGISGFANTLLFTSILSFAHQSRSITPVDLLVGFIPNAVMAWRERRFIKARKALPMIGILLLGLVPGTLFLRYGQDRLVKVLLGFAIIALAVEMWLRLRKPPAAKKPQKKVLLLLVGLCSGILCGLFGIGAFLVAYVSRTTDNINEMRGTICLVFLADNLLRLVLYTQLGLLTTAVFTTAFWLLPATALGLLAGILASRRIPEKLINNIIIALLLLMGVSVVLNNLL